MSTRTVATVLMFDIVGSTEIASRIGDARYRLLLDRFNRISTRALRRFRGHEEDRAGDGFFASFPQPAEAISCARTVLDDVRELGVEVRAALHTGETVVLDGKRQGLAVVICSRVLALAGAGEIVLTETTRQLVTGADLRCVDRGSHSLKGVEGEWRVWEVTEFDGSTKPPSLSPEEVTSGLERLPTTPGRRRRAGGFWLVAAAGSLLLVAGVLLWGRDPPPPVEQAPAPPIGSVVALTEDGSRVVHEDVFSWSPGAGFCCPPTLALSDGAVWVRSASTLTAIDPVTGDLHNTFARSGVFHPSAMTVGFGRVWTSDEPGLLTASIHSFEDTAPVTLPGVGGGRVTDIERAANAVSSGDDGLWTITSRGSLVLVDPRTRRIVASVDGLVAEALAVEPIDGADLVWVVDRPQRSVSLVDPATRSVLRAHPIGGAVRAIAAGEGSLWILDGRAGVVRRIDPVEGSIGTDIRVGSSPTAIVVGAGAVWVAHADGVLLRVDVETLQQTSFELGAPLASVAVDPESGTVFVAVA